MCYAWVIPNLALMPKNVKVVNRQNHVNNAFAPIGHSHAKLNCSAFKLRLLLTTYSSDLGRFGKFNFQLYLIGKLFLILYFVVNFQELAFIDLHIGICWATYNKKVLV